MNRIIAATLLTAAALWPAPARAVGEPAVVAEAVPTWNVGDRWKFRTEKDLDRTVTQRLGSFEITMTLNNVKNTTSYTVAGRETVEGEDCYAVTVAGNQELAGIYGTTPAETGAAAGSLVQKSTFEGTEYRRTNDLAFVKLVMRSKGTIEIKGPLAGAPTPFESDSITIANPPVSLFRFPMVEGDRWRVSSALTTVTSGASSDSIVTTFNYDCRVIGAQSVRLANGTTHECVAISQKGTQTVQSQHSGINIDGITGTLFFAPTVGNRVLDEAEGEELLDYELAGKAPTGD